MPPLLSGILIEIAVSRNQRSAGYGDPSEKQLNFRRIAMSSAFIPGK